MLLFSPFFLFILFFSVPCVKDNGGCQQICVVHGYFEKCDCHLGYQLQADEKSCISGKMYKYFFMSYLVSSNCFLVY